MRKGAGVRRLKGPVHQRLQIGQQTIDIRTDVSRVISDSLNTFKIALASDVREGSSKSGKPGKPLHKAGEALLFSSDDSRELRCSMP